MFVSINSVTPFSYQCPLLQFAAYSDHMLHLFLTNCSTTLAQLILRGNCDRCLFISMVSYVHSSQLSLDLSLFTYVVVFAAAVCSIFVSWWLVVSHKPLPVSLSLFLSSYSLNSKHVLSQHCNCSNCESCEERERE